ncbi:MAG: hypothetical protein H6651_22980 [Ardenticatenales bacterium]|nr:hypothetical protein [Ardenticatenales bacterium]
MLADDANEIVLNITQPNAHTVVALVAAVEARQVGDNEALMLARNEKLLR